VFRAHSVERGKASAKHMIAAVEQFRPVQRPEIGDLFYNAKAARVAPLIRADAARIAGIDVPTHLAFDQRFTDSSERIDELHERGFPPLHQPQHRPARRTWPKP